MAQDIAAVLFSSARQNGSGRKPEWTCPGCRTTNFLDRTVCRWCAACRPATAQLRANNEGGVTHAPAGPQGRVQGARVAKDAGPDLRTAGVQPSARGGQMNVPRRAPWEVDAVGELQKQIATTDAALQAAVA
eukprot:11862524-Karenia_brevis.AAC.1